MAKIIFNDGEECTIDNIVCVNSSRVDLYGNIPSNETGFYLLREGRHALDFSEFNTIYKVCDNKTIFSNNGDVWVEPSKDVIVSVVWDTVDLEIPESIDVVVSMGDESETITLSEENDWTKEYKDVLDHTVFSVECEDIENYEKQIIGTTITYTEPRPEEPSIQEQINLLSEMCLDLDDRVYALEEAE